MAKPRGNLQVEVRNAGAEVSWIAAEKLIAAFATQRHGYFRAREARDQEGREHGRVSQRLIQIVRHHVERLAQICRISLERVMPRAKASGHEARVPLFVEA